MGVHSDYIEYDDCLKTAAELWLLGPEGADGNLIEMREVRDQ